MKFLPDERLYTSTDHCLRFLRDITDGDGALKTPERYHFYWRGKFSLKQGFAVKSFLATQELKSAEPWLWLDGEDGYAENTDHPSLRPLLPFIRLKRFDLELESRDTPLEGRPELYAGLRPAARSDFFRVVVLYKYGGIYFDMDMMFLRDLRALLRNGLFQDEFCYQWSSHMPHGNSAVLRLRQRSETAAALLARCAAGGTCHPKHAFGFAENRDLDLLVLPCTFFDPLWPHYDRKDRYGAAPFNRFADFFRRFGFWFRRRPGIQSYRDFFPGAFTYHWHNCWDAKEHPSSYFGFFNQEFDHILRDKLGVSPAAG
jgi:hypothetical protein